MKETNEIITPENIDDVETICKRVLGKDTLKDDDILEGNSDITVKMFKDLCQATKFNVCVLKEEIERETISSFFIKELDISYVIKTNFGLDILERANEINKNKHGLECWFD